MSGISAQGSTLQVATGTGGAKTITAITVGFPAIVTSAAHGLNNGDVVTLAGIVGTMSSLNGTSRVVSNKTTNTFALLDADTTGLVYTSGGTATPVTYTNDQRPADIQRLRLVHLPSWTPPTWTALPWNTSPV